MGNVGRVLVKPLIWVLIILSLAAAGVFVADEMKTSDLQARLFSSIDEKVSYQAEPGPSPVIHFPESGPYDQRLGYALLPDVLKRLQEHGLTIEAQARLSPTLLNLMERGFNAPYSEKSQAGLTLFDRDGTLMFADRYPVRTYPDLESIPPLILNTLLFIENRELLSEHYPHLNPAVEWDRFARATAGLVARKLGADIHVTGGSTLATQIEKYRHSPGGRTESPLDKLQQMGSASFRAYRWGPETLKARRDIALTYLNSLPLAAIPGYGEVHGLGDGLWAWFSDDFDQVNRLLSADSMAAADGITREQALAYRRVLCLLLAQRRPAWYLRDGQDDLQTLADSHLRVMAANGVISPALRDAALAMRSELGVKPMSDPTVPFIEHKTENVLRARLASTLGLERLYDLDRLDLTAHSTLDLGTQQAVRHALRKLSEPKEAAAAGVIGGRLLSAGSKFDPIVYSLILFEVGPQGNRLRVQADNFDAPLDVNEGIRLDLGSTAKLRTLIHYLEIIAQLHGKYAAQPTEELLKLKFNKRDQLSQWVVKEIIASPRIDLRTILQNALDRKYSGSPGEAFFTGGGLHVFANFNNKNNGIMTVRKGLQQSVNLVFIRMMRDLAYFHLYGPDGVAGWVDEEDSEKRQEYLARFVDKEGITFQRRFYDKYRGKNPQQAMDLLIQGVYPLPHRVATVYRSIYPQRDLAAFTEFMHTRYPVLSAEAIDDLFHKYAVDRFDLQDRGYIARVHPLELWQVGYLAEHPNATFTEVASASKAERQQVYRWLMKDSKRQAQDKRIATLLEVDAFMKIHDAWKRVGYPFETMTPSYASAIGASGDRPAALAELIGILVNDGKRLPMVRYDTLEFAAGTPYETLLKMSPQDGEQVLLPEVAEAARGAVVEVVQQGTAIRLKGVYKGPDGTPLVVGGKTGTGDHRREIFGSRGRRITSQVISRAAVFTFFMGDRLFGVMTAYVTGPTAAHYRFTSALPVQILKSLEPTLRPLIARAYEPPPKEVEPPAPPAAVEPVASVTPVVIPVVSSTVPETPQSVASVARQADKGAKVAKPKPKPAPSAARPAAKDTKVVRPKSVPKPGSRKIRDVDQLF
jgi:membrane peptidoglycan carboxypeptidase